jgi:polyferredoxin
MDVLRDRNALYRVASGTTVENSYTLRISNRTESERTFVASVSGLEGATVIGDASIVVGPGEIGSLPTTIEAPTSVLRGSTDVVITLSDPADPAVSISRESRFFGPIGGSR